MFLLAVITLLAWVYLACFHGRFWEAHVPDDWMPDPPKWPDVVAVVPARNEAETIMEVVRGILGQDYPGKLSLIVVDDHSEDKTGNLAFMAAQQVSKAGQITVLKGQPLPEGWAGKVWAMQQGWEEAGKTAPDFVWFTDADIAHEPQALRGLVIRAEHEDLALNSAMVQLRCKGFWEKALVPAFVYFFKLLYPFQWVNDPEHKVAGAAGGSMLARQSVMGKINGPSAIKGALIDDCALARAVQDAGGKLRLELTRDSYSLRGYPTAADAWNTIARTAYTQLRYNPWMLAGSVLGLGLLFLLPCLWVLELVLAIVLGEPNDAYFVVYHFSYTWLTLLFTFTVMSISFLPQLRFYRRSSLWALVLPLITVFYLGATLDSARRYYAGSGGRWKGRSVER